MDDFSDAVRDLAAKKYGYTFGVFDQVLTALTPIKRPFFKASQRQKSMRSLLV
jgi:hypothetical protein